MVNSRVFSALALGLGGVLIMPPILWEYLGWIGGILGVPAGFMLGWISAMVFAEVLDYLFDIIARDCLRVMLWKHFGLYWTNAKNDRWAQLSDYRPTGDTLQGRVVFKSPEYLYLDLGLGFPGQIFIHRDQKDDVNPGDVYTVDPQFKCHPDRLICLSVPDEDPSKE